LDLKLKDTEHKVFFAKKWDATAQEQKLNVGDTMSVGGNWDNFNNQDYLNIRDLTIDIDGAIDKALFIEKMEPDVQAKYELAFEEFKGSVSNVDHIKLVKLIFNEDFCKNEFFVYPAGIQMHHSGIGGLLQHTVEVCKIALNIFETMMEWHSEMERSLLITSALLHDIGKCTSYTIESGLPQIKHSEYMVGHAVFALEKIAIAEKVLKRKFNRIKHLICSHQGKREYGAVKTPAMKEAFILHYADMLSGQFGVLDSLDYDSTGKAWYSGVNGYVFKSGELNVGN